MTPEFLTWESIWMVVRRRERAGERIFYVCVCVCVCVCVFIFVTVEVIVDHRHRFTVGSWICDLQFGRNYLSMPVADSC